MKIVVFIKDSLNINVKLVKISEKQEIFLPGI